MTTQKYIKPAALVALVVIALVGSPGLMNDRHLWARVGLVAFGAFNIWLPAPGTLWVRLASVVGVATTLAVASDPLDWAALGIVFLWPSGILFSWAITHERAELADAPLPSPRATTARAGVAAIIVAAALASLFYHWLVAHSLQQTSALFIGIPTLLAILVVFGASPRSAVGVVTKAVTVALLVSMVFLDEGMLCVVMSAPLIYAVAIAITAIVQALRERHFTYSWAVLLLVAPMTLEGVTPMTTVDRHETISQSGVVHASAAEVERALRQSPRFDRGLPAFLRVGFPTAIATSISETPDGLQWTVRFRGGEMRLNGMEPRTGDLVLRLEHAGAGVMAWRALSDTSHMTHFLFWQDAEVRWEALTDETTRVTWTLKYERGLDPAWYFGPWERYAVRLAAGYLVGSVATP